MPVCKFKSRWGLAQRKSSMWHKCAYHNTDKDAEEASTQKESDINDPIKWYDCDCNHQGGSWNELYMLQTSTERKPRPSGVNQAKSYASAASQWNSEWMWTVTLGRQCSQDTLHYRGRFPFNVGIKTNKYLRAEGVNRVERECSFCVEGRAKAMIQKAAKPLTASDAGQFLSVFISLFLRFFFFSLSQSVICLYTIMATAVCKSYVITLWMPSAEWGSD